MRVSVLLLVVLSLAACAAGPAQQVPQDSTSTATLRERPPAAIGPGTALPQARHANAQAIASPTKMPTTTSTASERKRYCAKSNSHPRLGPVTY